MNEEFEIERFEKIKEPKIIYISPTPMPSSGTRLVPKEDSSGDNLMRLMFFSVFCFIAYIFYLATKAIK